MLEANGIEPQVVSGTSAGSVVGALYASGMDPFELLGHTLDGMVQAGLLPPARRPGAEFMAWSAVHGMAMLMLDGPLRGVDEAGCQALAERLVAMVEQGLLAEAAA